MRDPERLERLADVIPEAPGVEDRAADAWEPLIAIADAAGGDWPRRPGPPVRALSDSAADADEDLGVLLLSDIRELFKVYGQIFLSSNQLVRDLRDIEESPWGHGDEYDLTASKLAKQLKPFGVKPGHNAAKTARSYSITSFHDASSATSVQKRPAVQEMTLSSINRPKTTKPRSVRAVRKSSGRTAFRTGPHALGTLRTQTANGPNPLV